MDAAATISPGFKPARKEEEETYIRFHALIRINGASETYLCLRCSRQLDHVRIMSGRVVSVRSLPQNKQKDTKI